MRFSVVGVNRVGVLTVFLGLLMASFALTDRAVAEEPEVDSTPPTVVGGALSPSSLPPAGGNVQLSAEVVDESGVQSVTAQIYGSDGSFQSIQLYQGDVNTYFGTLEVPANFSDSPMSYGVEFEAYDVFNNFTANSIGEVQVEGQPQFDEAPYVTEPQVWPQFLPAEGGSVTISADAGDNRSVSFVFATIALPGGGSAEVPLQPVSSSHFEGTYTVPPNPGPLAAEYPVEVVAQDDIGQEGRALAPTITVEAPPVVSAGRLEIKPADRSFGKVKVGRTAERVIAVRNLPRKGGEPVAATALIDGSGAFSIVGSAGSAVHFVLQPGQKRAFRIAFRPTVPGEQFAALRIVRDDGAQPDLSVGLSGNGSR